MFNKVFVMPPTLGANVTFKAHGFELVDSPDQAEAIVLCGGEDINPVLYNQPPIPGTYWSEHRDNREVMLIREFRGKVPMLGICRGAQLLNVFAGGSMYQDVDKHAGGHHDVILNSPRLRPRVFKSNSVHHQMMIPGPGADLMGTAQVSTRRSYGELDITGGTVVRVDRSKSWLDPEVIYYEKDDFFCFQGHPEFGHVETEETYFEILHELYQQP